MKKLVNDILNQHKIRTLYLLGCGGSLAALSPARSFVDAEARQLVCLQMGSNEFVHTPQSRLGSDCIAVVVSHQGNTPETVEAARHAKAAGAIVVAFTYQQESSPLSEAADYTVRYDWGPGHDVAREKTMLVLQLAVSLVAQTEGYDTAAFDAALQKIDALTKSAMRASEQEAQDFAKDFQDVPFLYVMGSGASFSAAYMESICVLMEMQWIHSAAIHTGDYFHGPFEVTEEDTPFLLQISAGHTRALDQRAQAFLQAHNRHYAVIDAEALGLGAIDARVRDYFEHTFFTNVYDVYNHALAEIRQHPLMLRRYMWKIAY